VPRSKKADKDRDFGQLVRLTLDDEWKSVRLKILVANGLDKAWKEEYAQRRQRINPDNGRKIDWRVAEAEMEEKYAYLLQQAKFDVYARQPQVEAMLLSSRNLANATKGSAEFKAIQRLSADTTGRVLDAAIKRSIGLTQKSVDLDPKPKPQEGDKFGWAGGLQIVENPPEHWATASNDINRSTVHWAFNRLSLAVSPNDAPSAAAWNLLMIGRADPKSFSEKFAVHMLPKKDADDRRAAFDEDSTDCIEDLGNMLVAHRGTR